MLVSRQVGLTSFRQVTLPLRTRNSPCCPAPHLFAVPLWHARAVVRDGARLADHNVVTCRAGVNDGTQHIQIMAECPRRPASVQRLSPAHEQQWVPETRVPGGAMPSSSSLSYVPCRTPAVI